MIVHLFKHADAAPKLAGDSFLAQANLVKQAEKSSQRKGLAIRSFFAHRIRSQNWCVKQT